MRNPLWLLLFFLPFNAMAQTVIATNLPKDIYLNLPNVIDVGSFDVPLKDLCIETNNGSIVLNGAQYIWTPAIKSDIDPWLRIFNARTGVFISELRFILKEIGIPQVKLNGRGMDGEPVLMNFRYLEFDFGYNSGKFRLDTLSRIISFKASIRDTLAGMDTVFSFVGNYVSDEFRNALMKCHAGANIRLFDILVNVAWIKNSPFLYDDYFLLYRPLNFTLY